MKCMPASYIISLEMTFKIVNVMNIKLSQKYSFYAPSETISFSSAQRLIRFNHTSSSLKRRACLAASRVSTNTTEPLPGQQI